MVERKKRIMRLLALERKAGCLANQTLWVGRPQRGECGGILWPALLWNRQEDNSELGRHVTTKLRRVEVFVACDEKIKVRACSRQEVAVFNAFPTDEVYGFGRMPG
jgi:hypothetical protein